MSTLVETLRQAFSLRRAEPPALPESLERLAREAVGRGLETPALVLVESIAPLSFLGGQAAFAVSPLARMLGLGGALPEIAAALEDRRILRALADRIERLAEERGREAGR
jgi:hypothetical protein